MPKGAVAREIKADRPEPYQDVYKRFAHDQSSWVVTGVKKMQELIQELNLIHIY